MATKIVPTIQTKRIVLESIKLSKYDDEEGSEIVDFKNDEVKESELNKLKGSFLI